MAITRCSAGTGTKVPALLADTNPIVLETAVGRARVGCDGVRWQGETTLRAPARKEKQRRKQAPARLNRVRSAVTLEVTLLVSTKARVHKAYPAEESGQLRFLGLSALRYVRGTLRRRQRWWAARTKPDIAQSLPARDHHSPAETESGPLLAHRVRPARRAEGLHGARHHAARRRARSRAVCRPVRAIACTSPCAARPASAIGWGSGAGTLPRGWPTNACNTPRPGRWCGGSRRPGTTAPRTS